MQSTHTTTSGSPVLFIVLFVVIIGVIVFLYIRKREITFTGEVIDKDVSESQMNNNNLNRPGAISINNGGVRHTFTIKVKTDAGKTVHYQISEGKYEIIKIGDRVSKAKGTTDVEIISSGAANPAGPANPAAASQPQPVTPGQPPTQTPSFVAQQTAAPQTPEHPAQNPPGQIPPQAPTPQV